MTYAISFLAGFAAMVVYRMLRQYEELAEHTAQVEYELEAAERLLCQIAAGEVYITFNKGDDDGE